jgi:predicted kinase
LLWFSRRNYFDQDPTVPSAEQPQMEAVIFVGVQGSGKTSFYREKFADTHTRISLDVLKTRPREKAILADCLATKRSFVVDNTNPLPTDRARYIGPAREARFRVVAYLFETELRDAIKRNNQRSGKEKIPAGAIVATFRKLRPPSLQEGFNAIYKVTISPQGAFVVTDNMPHED